MRRLLKLFLQKPELASSILLLLLVVAFQIRSNAVFLSVDNLRGILGLLPETALVAVGVTQVVNRQKHCVRPDLERHNQEQQ